MIVVFGIFLAQSIIWASSKSIILAKTTFHNIQNLNGASFQLASLVSIPDLRNLLTFSRVETIENPLLENQEAIYSALNPGSNDPERNEIFLNPARRVFEDFPENGPDYINQHQISEDLTIPDDGKVIVANLETMSLYLYKDGEKIQEFEILSKGRPGTPWETPPGMFEIRYKTENHFSSIGEVWLPYSMQFFGNYFIHGWPHHSDGTPVPRGYSGGCIRLADEDARAIYQFAELGTKVLVLGTTKETISENQSGYYKVENLNLYPSITSRSYIVADLESGDILFSKDAQTPYAIASITKLMTALVSLETINQYLYTTVSQTAYNTHGWRGNFYVGERILTGDLIFPLILQSSNKAGEVLAEFAGRDNFIRNMNIRAKSLGLENTTFADASGLSPYNISTAYDLLRFSDYVYRYKRYIFDVSNMRTYVNEKHEWPNTHRLTGESFFLGGKNGFTDAARHTLISLVELPVRTILHDNEIIKDFDSENQEPEYTNRKFAIILLQAERTEEDTRKFIDYIKSSVKYVRVND